MEKYNFELSRMDVHVLYEALCQYIPYVQLLIDNVDNVKSGEIYKEGEPVERSRMEEGERKLKDLKYWDGQIKHSEELIDRIKKLIGGNEDSYPLL